MSPIQPVREAMAGILLQGRTREEYNMEEDAGSWETVGERSAEAWALQLPKREC